MFLTRLEVTLNLDGGLGRVLSSPVYHAPPPPAGLDSVEERFIRGVCSEVLSFKQTRGEACAAGTFLRQWLPNELLLAARGEWA